MSQKTKQLKIFIFPKGIDLSKGGPANPPIFKEVNGTSIDDLKKDALKMLSELGEVNSLNFTPDGLVGYVVER